MYEVLLNIVKKYSQYEGVKFQEPYRITNEKKVGRLNPTQMMFYRAFRNLDLRRESEEVLIEFQYNFEYLDCIISAIEAIYKAFFAYSFPSTLIVGQSYYIDLNYDVYIVVDNCPN